MSYRALVVIGPTATGKTRLAVQLARRFGGEIVSADSRQVYRGLDIGTGKDLAEYVDGGMAVPYHLIDVVEPIEEFHLFKYLDLVRKVFPEIEAAGHLPIVAGGSPLYVKALLDGYDQEGAAPNEEFRQEMELLTLPELVAKLQEKAPEALMKRTDLTQKRRVIRALEIASFGKLVNGEPLVGESLLIAPFFPRPEIHRRIERRLKERLEQGLIEEVQHLHDNGLSWEKMEWLGLEYRFAARALTGKISLEKMQKTLLVHIRQFCKRQEGWFRHFEREGKVIHWIDGGNLESASQLVEKWLAGDPLPKPEIRLDDIRY